MSREGRDYLQIPEKQRLLEAECFRYIFKGCPRYRMIFEAFGGLGLLRQTLSQMKKGWEPDIHISHDHSERMIREILSRFPSVAAILGDTYELPMPVADPRPSLFSADFNSFSPLQMDRSKKKRRLIEAMVGRSPTSLQITDSAVFRLHLNRKAYEREWNTKITTPESYLRAVSRWFWERYGYWIDRAAYHRWASYYLLRRTKTFCNPVIRRIQ